MKGMPRLLLTGLAAVAFMANGLACGPRRAYLPLPPAEAAGVAAENAGPGQGLDPGRVSGPEAELGAGERVVGVVGQLLLLAVVVAAVTGVEAVRRSILPERHRGDRARAADRADWHP